MTQEIEAYRRVLGRLVAEDRAEAGRASARIRYSPIRSFRDRHDLTQPQFAALLGVSIRSVVNYEHGRAPRHVLLAMAALEDMFAAGR